MSYVDVAYYTDTYKGEAVSDSDFPIFAERASDMIDDITMYRICQETLASEIPFIQKQFKKAVCAQIEFINANGGTELYTSDNVQSAGLGKFNYSASASGGTKTIAPMAYTYLDPTGLLYRGL